MAKSFGELLRERREAAGLTALALAEKAGVSRNTVHNLERGDFTPHYRVLCRLADALGCKLDELRGKP